jgi:hypothetical protein
MIPGRASRPELGAAACDLPGERHRSEFARAGVDRPLRAHVLQGVARVGLRGSRGAGISRHGVSCRAAHGCVDAGGGLRRLFPGGGGGTRDPAFEGVVGAVRARTVPPHHPVCAFDSPRDGGVLGAAPGRALRPLALAGALQHRTRARAPAVERVLERRHRRVAAAAGAHHGGHVRVRRSRAARAHELHLGALPDCERERVARVSRDPARVRHPGARSRARRARQRALRLGLQRNSSARAARGGLVRAGQTAHHHGGGARRPVPRQAAVPGEALLRGVDGGLAPHADGVRRGLRRQVAARFRCARVPAEPPDHRLLRLRVSAAVAARHQDVEHRQDRARFDADVASVAGST